MNINKSKHTPVLLKECINSLKVNSGDIIIDATLGGGGYSKEILRNFKGQGILIAIDSDNSAIERFTEYLKNDGYEKNKPSNSFKKDSIEIYLINQNYDKLSDIISKLKIKYINGLIADLGMSTDQIFDQSKGFSYSVDGPLDMRMDSRLQVAAADLVNGLYKKELEKLFSELGDEWFSKKITNAIVKERSKRRITNTMQLKNIIAEAVPDYYKKGTANPAMRVFQALRIAVNHELDSLRSLLPQALEALRSGDRLVFVSFHSGEDRIIKNYFKETQNKNIALIINKKPIRPSEKEINDNPKSQSAKLRILEKL